MWTRLAIISRSTVKHTRIIWKTNLSTEPPDLAPDPLSMRSNPSRGDLDKLLGYPTPLLSLRNVLSGRELSSLSVHLKRLFSSRHPIVEQTKLFIDSQVTHTQGMLSLLTAKCFNILNNTLSCDEFGILASQRTIAEVTEMIHIAHTVHNGVVDFKERREEEELLFGNKMVILGGDILLARACKELSQLYNPQVVGLMSTGISILMKDSFYPNVTSKGISLLGKSCQSCIVLAQLDEEWEELGLALGNQLSIIHQLSMQSPVHEERNEVVTETCNSALYLLQELPNCQSKTALEEFITLQQK